MRRPASKPSPIRSTVASLRCRSIETSGYRSRNSGRIGATALTPNVIGTASRTSPRGAIDCDSASFSAASPSASSRVGALGQFLPGIGQRQPPRGAVEQPRAEPLLQPADRLRHRGLGQRQFGRGCCKRPQFHDFCENRQRFEIREFCHSDASNGSFLETMSFNSFYFYTTPGGISNGHRNSSNGEIQ